MTLKDIDIQSVQFVALNKALTPAVIRDLYAERKLPPAVWCDDCGGVAHYQTGGEPGYQCERCGHVEWAGYEYQIEEAAK